MSFHFSKKELWLFAVLLLLSALLRFPQLAYSHFYGDETKTLFVDKTQSAYTFFFSQRKAPLQFMTAWVVEKITNSFDEFAIRLPFAVAGFLAVAVFYLIVRTVWDYRAALFSAFLFSVNGFYIAFSRTAQYQSLYILFGLLSVLFAVLYLKNKSRSVFLVLSGTASALAFLSHYDAVFLFLTTVLILGYDMFRNFRLRSLLLFLVPFSILMAAFYLPYVFGNHFVENTAGYLGDRVSGTDFAPNNSIYTAKVYNPLLVAFVPLIFAVFAFLKGLDRRNSIVLFTFLLPFVVFEFVFMNPGTHIHNYYLPLFVLAGAGFFELKDRLSGNRLFGKILSAAVLVVFGLMYLINLVVFTPYFQSGYPWQPLKIGGWVFNNEIPDKRYHLYLYGFPYNVGWNQIKNFLSQQKGVRGFYTNDNTVTAHYYLRTLDLTQPGSNFTPQYFVEVQHSTEFKSTPVEFLQQYTKVKDFYVNGNLASTIYRRILPQ